MSICKELVSMLCGGPPASAAGGSRSRPVPDRACGPSQPVAYGPPARLPSRTRWSPSADCRAGDDAWQQSPKTFRREGQPIFDFLGGNVSKTFVQNVADAFQIDRGTANVRSVFGIGFAEPLKAADGGQVRLYRIVQGINGVIHCGEPHSSLRSSFFRISRKVRSIFSTRSTIRSTSRAASTSAKLGVLTTPGVMY